MRLDPKYFIPFLLIVAAICVVAIIFFNFRFIGGQQERMAKSLGDGTELLAQEFPIFFSDDTLILDDTEPRKIVVLFWASWSDRSVSARDYLLRIVSQTTEPVLFVMASVKDDATYLEDIQPLLSREVMLINATDFYADKRVPGIPSVITFNQDKSVYGMKIGFRKSDDYAFIRNWLIPEDN